MHIPKTVFLTLKSFGKLFLRAIRIQDFRSFSLDESLSKTASYKNGVWLRYVLRTSFFCILLFCHSLEAGNLKYDNCWNKHFANFKGLTENKVDLAFSVKSRALQFANLRSLQPSSSN